VSEASPALAGTTWRAVSVDGQPPIEGSEATAEFTDDRLYGTTGCNRYFGGYTLTDGALGLTPVAMTMMACDGPVGDLENVFVRVINAAESATIDAEGRLVLSGPGGTLVFVPDESTAEREPVP
jgi:heat shock protein HslJ